MSSGEMRMEAALHRSAVGSPPQPGIAQEV
jgi:hypothetical protein